MKFAQMSSYVSLRRSQSKLRSEIWNQCSEIGHYMLYWKIFTRSTVLDMQRSCNYECRKSLRKKWLYCPQWIWTIEDWRLIIERVQWFLTGLLLRVCKPGVFLMSAHGTVNVYYDSELGPRTAKLTLLMIQILK